MDWVVVAVIVWVTLIHMALVNPMEKLFTQAMFDASFRRPKKECSSCNTLSCLGMPSGHTETTSVCTSMLFFSGILSMPWAVAIVVAMAIQRVATKMHTINQVIMGGLLGFVYASVYATLLAQHTHAGVVVLVSLMFPIALIVCTTLYVSAKTYANVPSWVDPQLYPLIEKKRNISMFSKCITVSTMLWQHENTLFCSWREVEQHMDRLLAGITQPIDVVVGVKTGGAILSGYLAQKLRVPAYYVKVSASHYKCNKSETGMYTDVMNKYHASQLEYDVCEPIEDNIEGKNVLLIDELESTNVTITVVQEYLLAIKKVNSVLLTTIASKQSHSFHMTKAACDGMYVVWPWGFDN